MLREFTRFKVSIIDKEFQAGERLRHKNTAIISFLDNEDKEIKKIELAYIEKEDVYKLIDSGKDVHLDSCYIKDFSLSAYRASRNIAPKTETPLINFSASNTVFDAGQESAGIDFSYAIFQGQDHIISNSLFAGAPVSFESAGFSEGAVEFDYSFFQHGDVNFNNTKFGNGDVSFKNVIFMNGKKSFEGASFGQGSKLFMNVEFNEGEVNFENADFGQGRVSFKVARFGKGKIDFKNVKFGQGDVIFEMAEFGDGHVNFRGVNFGDGLVDFTRSEFGKGQVSFIGTDFGAGDINFVNTSFNEGKVSFKSANFSGGDSDFHYAAFGEGDIIFDRAKFGDGVVDFRAVDFNDGKVSFYRSEFGMGDADFEASEMDDGYLVFRHTIFGPGKLNFEMAEYEKATLVFEHVNFKNEIASFNRAKFDVLSIKSCQLNNYFDIRILQANQFDLSDCIIRDIIDIRSTEFDIRLKAFNLSGIRLLGRIYVDWKNLQIKKLIYEQDTEYRSKSEQFRILKENYNTIGQYDAEDYAYVEFKRTELKADINEAKKKNKISLLWEYPVSAFKWALFDFTGLYATNPIRVLLSMFIIYLLFSFLYISIPFLTGQHIFSSYEFTSTLSYIKTCFYFSGVTFYTIGYGDLTPTGVFRGIAVLEGFVGVFMMAYFTVAFVRKILR